MNDRRTVRSSGRRGAASHSPPCRRARRSGLHADRAPHRRGPILPIVVGGIAAALLSVFGLQDQTQNRIGASDDAQVGSANFNKDVQSAGKST